MKSIHSFKQMKQEGRKISMVTCYDSCFAKILAETEIDMLLVGDSVAMVYHGFDSTIHATMPMMVMHTAAVARGAPKKFIIGDMPFLTFKKGPTVALDAAAELMRAGADCVKLEGLKGHEGSIEALIGAGIPVMGHLGLTPQSVHQLGGHKVQAKESREAEILIAEAKKLEEMGCFSLVLECVPSELAQKVSVSLKIPCIGIGAGVGTDGQVLVLHDMLGASPEFKPKFLRQYSNLSENTKTSINQYVKDVQEKTYPSAEESYKA
ncbi:3-methyl-2-oxobutanoate hydroxymethyltransferase [bacterium]|nr:3-methyl-2-oxobutanoate hydroxymethyltransferase [bacterium]